jgi:hypothetical protein
VEHQPGRHRERGDDHRAVVLSAFRRIAGRRCAVFFWRIACRRCPGLWRPACRRCAMSIPRHKMAAYALGRRHGGP